MPNLIGDYLYKTLPPLYRIQDKDTNYTLQRYLDALGESMSLVNDETKGILTLLDVEKMEAKFLPHFASMFGVEYNYDIPEDTQRKYLANIVDIQKRKGTKEVLEFTARELTGMNATVKEGHSLRFKTWGRSLDSEKCEEYEPPKTYGGKNKIPYYLVGGDNTDRFTVIVHLSTEKNTDTEVIFLNTQILSRLTKELVQPYINLRYKATGILDSDTHTLDLSSIVEWHRDSLNDSYKRKGNIKEHGEFIQAIEKFAYTHKHKNEEEMLDNVKLLVVPHMTVEERQVEEQEGMIYILDKTELSMTLDVTDEESWLITTKGTETVVKNVKDSDIIRISNTDTLEDLTVEYEDLGVTANRTSAYNEVLTLKSSYSKDSIHLNTDYDIITLGNVTDDYEDKIISNYEFLSQQYALKHEGIPNNLTDTNYRFAPSIPNPVPPQNWNTFGYWVTTYLEEGKGEVDENNAIELANIKLWGYDPSTDTWTILDVGFESQGWRTEDLVYEDSCVTFSGTSKTVGSTSWGNTEGYILRHRGSTRGYASVVYGHQEKFNDYTNYTYYIAQVDFRLVKYTSSSYDSLDEANILVNISNSWRASADGVCEHDWSKDKVSSFGRYLKATRDWRTAYTTNLPQNWEGAIPSELQPTKEKGE